MLKKQNKDLLKKIAIFKNLNEDETEDLIANFWKIGYYTPIIIEDKEEENSQYYLFKKKYKNIKDKYRKINNGKIK